MAPLGTLFKTSNSRPKIDQHSLFTSIQISMPVLQGTLQVYEPWKRKGMKARPCHVTLYANDTSPFLVWYKTNNNMDGSGQTNDNIQRKPRCVLCLNRANVTKTTGGCFEVVDFKTSLLFRFVAPTVRESEEWVEKLQEESIKEANLDMGSMCSSCSSSSFGSHPSPDAINSKEFNSFLPSSGNNIKTNLDGFRKHCRSESYSDAISSFSSEHQIRYNNNSMPRPSRLFSNNEQLSNNNSNYYDKSSPNGEPAQRHTRAQPHLGVNIHTVDKCRPTLDNIISLQRQASEPYNNRELLPLSEYFVNLPDS